MEKDLLPPTFLSLRLLKTNPICLLPRLNPTPFPPTQRLNQRKCEKLFGPQ